MDPYMSYHPATRSPWVGHYNEGGVKVRISALKAQCKRHDSYYTYNPDRLRVFKLDEFEDSVRYVEVTNQFLPKDSDEQA